MSSALTLSGTLSQVPAKWGSRLLNWPPCRRKSTTTTAITSSSASRPQAILLIRRIVHSSRYGRRCTECFDHRCLQEVRARELRVGGGAAHERDALGPFGRIALLERLLVLDG